MRAATVPSNQLASVIRAALMIAASSSLPLSLAIAQNTAGSVAPGVEEITVTATRQQERLSRVPLSVAAYDQDQLDDLGVKSVDDVVRLTPGIAITRTSNTNTVAIRGVSSSAGASTTGIYIDNIPIQVRNLGYAYGSAFPVVFDLERIEVLRGPQGTLFGAGPQGGTLRFIQPAPDLQDDEVYGRAEAFSTEGGDAGYEGGLVLNMPLVTDVLGLRLSAFHRRDSGWIDAKCGSFEIVDPTGASLGHSARFNTTGIAERNANWKKASAGRVALTYAPNDSLRITPSVFYQRELYNEAGDTIYHAASDFSRGDFGTPRFVAGPPDERHIAIPEGPNNRERLDRFYLPSLAIEWDGPGFTFASDTAYFHRNVDMDVDATLTYVRLLGRQSPEPGDKTYSRRDDQQRNFTQEFRLQSADRSARFTWLVGAFYSHNEQRSVQAERPNFFSLADNVYGAVPDGDPFGPGSSAFINAFGVPPLPDGTTYFGDFFTKEEQKALFGQVDYKLTDQWKVSVGVRASENELSYLARYNGPEQNLNAPYGIPCPTGPGTCVPGEGIFTPDYGGGGASSKDHPITPKISVSYQADEANLFYATVSQGFRPSGAQARMTTQCNPDLIANGFVDENGNAAPPVTYDSDTVWNYELGSKNRLLGDRLAIDGSVYWIEWDDIQGNVSLPVCASVITTNLGSATSRGFDLAVQLRPLDNLTFGTAVGYNKTTFDQAIANPTTGAITFSKGSAVPGAGAPWTVTVNTQYDFTLLDRDLYARADYTYSSEFRRTGNTDPLARNYDPLILPQQEASLLNARIGTTIGGVDVAFFMNNVLDARPHLNFSRSSRTVLFTDNTFRPRTFGLTATVRY